jgi:hypothetical protein
MSSPLAGSEFTGASPNVLEGSSYYGFEDAENASTFAGSYAPVTARVQQCGGKRARTTKSKRSVRKNLKNHKKSKSRRLKAKSMKKNMKKSMRKSHNKSMKKRRSLKARNKRR